MVSGCAVHLPREVRSPTDPPHRAPCITPRAHPARSPGFLTTARRWAGPFSPAGSAAPPLRASAALYGGALHLRRATWGVRSAASAALTPAAACAQSARLPQPLTRRAPLRRRRRKKEWGFASLRCSHSSRSRWYAARISALEPERPVTGRQPPRPRRNSERSPPARRRATRFTSTA